MQEGKEKNLFSILSFKCTDKGMIRSSPRKLELEKSSLEIRHFLVAVRKILRQLMRREWIYLHTEFL